MGVEDDEIRAGSHREFRAIKDFTVSDLRDLVVIAGPNGCGKSCILDAIRLLKSVYGGYQSNEWQMWFGEFQLNLNDPANLRGMFRDATKPIIVEADITLAASEIKYLKENADRLCELVIWGEETRVGSESFGHSSLAYAAQFPQLIATVKSRTGIAAEALRVEADNEVHHLRLKLTPSFGIEPEFSLLAKIVFTTYEPDHLGIIDFHSASRSSLVKASAG